MNPYRVIYGQLVIECASAEDVAALAVQLSAGTQKSVSPSLNVASPNFSTLPPSRWNERRVKEYYSKLLDEKQRKVVDALYDSHDGRTQKELMGLVGFDSGSQLSGLMSALVRNAKKVAADPADVYKKHAITVGDGGYDYQLTDGLRQALQLIKNGHRPVGVSD